MRLLKLKGKKPLEGLYETSIISFFGNGLEISKDLVTGKRNICLVKYKYSSELIPNLEYPVHSNYIGEDGYELKCGDRVCLITKIENTYWAIRKVGEDIKPYVISDELLKKALLSYSSG